MKMPSILLSTIALGLSLTASGMAAARDHRMADAVPATPPGPPVTKSSGTTSCPRSRR